MVQKYNSYIKNIINKNGVSLKTSSYFFTNSDIKTDKAIEFYFTV